MSTGRSRITESRLRQPPPPAQEAQSALRAELESVWSISASDGTGAAVDAVLTYAGNVLQRDPDEADNLVALVAEIAGLSEPAARRALFRHAVRRLVLGRGDPAVSIGSQLRLLVALAPIAAASVWLASTDGSVEPVAVHGSLATTRRCKRAAAFAIAGDDVTLQPHGSRVRIHAYPLRRRDRRDGALVVRLGAESYPEALPYLEEFALVFGAVLERELLLRASSSDERRLGETYERRLVRTAFDLHDGPLQDVAALAAELRLLRSQLEGTTEVPRDVLLGRIDDVAGRVAELDHSVRAITQSLETSTVVERPLGEALEREARHFEKRTAATANLRMSGAFDALTVSQRIAILRVVQEALSNAGTHSGATHVEISVRAGDDGVELQVVDNGRGFDLRATAASAARRGRLGIVGMNERIRLLGGTFALESVPGMGTTVSAAIPAWRPLPGS